MASDIILLTDLFKFLRIEAKMRNKYLNIVWIKRRALNNA